MNVWTLGAALWLAAAGTLAVAVGKAINRADRIAAARQRYSREAVTEARARIVSRYPSVTMDGRVPHHIAVRVIRQAQGEQVGL